MDFRQLCYLQPVKIQIDSSKIGIRTSFFILQKILLLIFLRTILVCFGSFWNKSVCFSCLFIHFRFVSVHFETNLFVSVVSMHIFGLFWFILKQNCLFRLFRNSFETPKQTETRLSLVSKMNRNKRETDPVSVIFGSNRIFFLFVSWTP